jgi:hypothetical protein
MKMHKMTKLIKIPKKPSKDMPRITREMLAKIGETIYNSEEVKGIRLQVVFKDNSAITFKRSEVADTFEIMDEEE